MANAVRSHLDRRRDTIATMKSLGATGGRVFAIYLVQVMAIAAIGTVIGLVIGAALPFAIDWAFGAILPLPIEPALQPVRTGARSAVRTADGARLRGLAARPRP